MAWDLNRSPRRQSPRGLPGTRFGWPTRSGGILLSFLTTLIFFQCYFSLSHPHLSVLTTLIFIFPQRELGLSRQSYDPSIAVAGLLCLPEGRKLTSKGSISQSDLL
jgi:hypothetical protein